MTPVKANIRRKVEKKLSGESLIDDDAETDEMRIPSKSAIEFK